MTGNGLRYKPLANLPYTQLISLDYVDMCFFFFQLHLSEKSLSLIMCKY